MLLPVLDATRLKSEPEVSTLMELNGPVCRAILEPTETRENPIVEGFPTLHPRAIAKDEASVSVKMAFCEHAIVHFARTDTKSSQSV